MEFYLLFSLNFIKEDGTNFLSSTLKSNMLSIEDRQTIKLIKDFKKDFDFKKIISSENVYKNEQACSILKNKYSMNIAKINKKINNNFYVCEYQLNKIIARIIFYEFTESELITPEILDSDGVLITSVDRTFKYLNNLSTEEKIIYDFYLDDIINEIMEQQFYYLTDLPFENLLKTKLFMHQKSNINWMINVENELDEYITVKKYVNFKDGRIYCYDESRFVEKNGIIKYKLKGGIIFDDVGTGKTLQFICLCLSKPLIKTLLLVPDHLYEHWNNQFSYHLKIEKPDNVIILRFSNYVEYDGKYDRVIVDEIHELYSNSSNTPIFNKLINTDCDYKWGLSATLFPVPNSMYYLLEFLTSREFNPSYVERFNDNIQIYPKIIRKNRLEDINKEINLPDISINNIMIDFTTRERVIYDAEVMADSSKDIEFLRKICCDISLSVMDESDGVFYKDFNTMIQESFEKKWLSNKLIYEELVVRLQKLETVYDFQQNESLLQNIYHYRNEIIKQEKIVNERLKAFEFLKNQFESILTCPVCLGDIDVNTNCSIINKPSCNHSYCQSCLDFLIEDFKIKKYVLSCAICRCIFERKDVINISNGPPAPKHASKIVKLLEIINSSDEKFIIYTQFSAMISKLNNVLTESSINSIEYKSEQDIINFKNDDIKVLFLCSTKNASGLDLSFVNNIIIFEPVNGIHTYLRDVEKQIIGRIHRIGQTKISNVYRLIINDTIEKDLYDELS